MQVQTLTLHLTSILLCYDWQHVSTTQAKSYCICHVKLRVWTLKLQDFTFTLIQNHSVWGTETRNQCDYIFRLKRQATDTYNQAYHTGKIGLIFAYTFALNCYIYIYMFANSKKCHDIDEKQLS